MRLRVLFELKRTTAIAIDHQHELQGLVYSYLAISDEGYCRFLHGRGYAQSDTSTKVAKLFCYSSLRVPASRRRMQGSSMIVSPGIVEWYITSPLNEFLLHSVTGMLATGTMVRVGTMELEVVAVESLHTPDFTSSETFTCLSPIVVARSREDKTREYLLPDDSRFSDMVMRNLLWKRELLQLNGVLPTEGTAEPTVRLDFDRAYLQRPGAHNGTKLVTYKGISMKGAFAPFRLTGSPELIQLAWECGVGRNNSIGLGMVELKSAGGRL